MQEARYRLSKGSLLKGKTNPAIRGYVYQLQEALYEEARKTPYLSAADSAAMRQVESMYQSVLTQLNPEYRIVAVLDMNLNQGN